jgi:hypothetical protein
MIFFSAHYVDALLGSSETLASDMANIVNSKKVFFITLCIYSLISYFITFVTIDLVFRNVAIVSKCTHFLRYEGLIARKCINFEYRFNFSMEFCHSLIAFSPQYLEKVVPFQHERLRERQTR